MNEEEVLISEKTIPKFVSGYSLFNETIGNENYFVFQHSILNNDYQLNEESFQIFSMINGKNSLEDMASALTKTFEVDKILLIKDLKGLILRLKELGLLEIQIDDK